MLLVVGSVAYDDVETPFGREPNALGGSATFFSVSSSHFTHVSLIGIVGEDFAPESLALLHSRGVDTSGLVSTAGKTFRWKGSYEGDMNCAHTHDTQLHVFADFNPQLSASQRDAEYLFLGNIEPRLQLSVLDQVHQPRLVALDTMNYWIDTKREDLLKVIARVDLVIINDAEARSLTGIQNIQLAADKLLEWGPKYLVIKRGEFGALLVTRNDRFALPAYPVRQVVDPTGAGDTFAGGFMGHLAKTDDLTAPNLRKAVVYGSIMASFAVEDFSMRRTAALKWDEIAQRLEEYRAYCAF